MSTRILSRLLCLVLSILVFFVSSLAIAEEVDLASMSNDQIIVLLTRVNDELMARGLQKTATLAKGSYIAGKDIPCGSYVFTCLATGDDWGNVTI